MNKDGIWALINNHSNDMEFLTGDKLKLYNQGLVYDHAQLEMAIAIKKHHISDLQFQIKKLKKTLLNLKSCLDNHK